MIPLFDSEAFAFIGSADGELIVNCRECHREAEVQIDPGAMVLRAICPDCAMQAQFKFRPSARIMQEQEITTA